MELSTSGMFMSPRLCGFVGSLGFPFGQHELLLLEFDDDPPEQPPPPRFFFFSSSYYSPSLSSRAVCSKMILFSTFCSSSSFSMCHFSHFVFTIFGKKDTIQ